KSQRVRLKWMSAQKRLERTSMRSLTAELCVTGASCATHVPRHAMPKQRKAIMKEAWTGRPLRRAAGGNRRLRLSRLRDPSGRMYQYRVELLARFLEHRERGPVEHAPARQFDRHRVYEAIVDEDLEMHVRTGRQAGRTDEADDLALAHAAADIEPPRECRHVAVGGLIAVGVADAHIFAVAALDADFVDAAVAGGEDRRAERRRPIDAGMRLHIVQQRVIALAEARSHDADRDRLAHQEL